MQIKEAFCGSCFDILLEHPDVLVSFAKLGVFPALHETHHIIVRPSLPDDACQCDACFSE